jgi:predicted DNA-binding transcriptional regulator AlpA
MSSSSDKYTKQDTHLGDADGALTSEPSPQGNVDATNALCAQHLSRAPDEALQFTTEVIEERFVSVKFLCERYDLSRQTIWRRVKYDDDFPKPVKLSMGATRWKYSDLLRYERTLTSTLKEQL